MAKAMGQRNAGVDRENIDFDEIPNSVIEHLIDEWIHSERDRKILKRRIIDGICYEPLADEMDMSVRQIKYIVYKAEAKLFKHLN